MDRSDVTNLLVDEQTGHLVATASTLSDEQVRGPSLCQGWSRGHVLAHLARNAEGIARAVRAAMTGSDETMYAGLAERDADIESGAGRSARDLAADVRDTAARLSPLLAQVRPHELRDVTFERTPGGERVFAARLPFMRLREVVIHHIDLDSGFDFGDIPDDIAELFLRDAAKRLDATDGAPAVTLETTEGDHLAVNGGGVAVRGSRAGVLRWLLRQDPREVATADAAGLPELPKGF